MNESRYTVLEKASFRPDKIVFYKQFVPNFKTEKIEKQKYDPKTKEFLASIGAITIRQPKTNKHEFEISRKASSRIKEKVNWLYTLSKSKTVNLKNGKKLHAFKMNFITLSLPSIQKHTTSEITNQCLNQFLTECKQRFGLTNYVWRLEFQKNGNVHYHIATDCFIEFWQCRTIWNRCLDKLKYVENYTNRMRGLTFLEYRNLDSNRNNQDFNKLRERYALGCAQRWTSPNTVDVRAVNNSKNIAFYISKYITKPSEHSLNPIVMEREPAETNLRLWFCSRSLSKLDKIEIFMEEYNEKIIKILNLLEKTKNYIFDYCSIKYFNYKEQNFECKAWLWRLYNDYAKEQGYTPSLN